MSLRYGPPARPLQRLKLIMTPIWDQEMGQRFRWARMKLLRTQAEIAGVLNTDQHPIGQRQIAAIESGRRHSSQITWARLEAVMGPLTSYVLTAKDAAVLERQDVASLYFDYRQRAMRKRNGLDPKKGECPPWPRTYSSRPLPPRKRGSTR